MPKAPRKIAFRDKQTGGAIRKARQLNAHVDSDPEPFREPEPSTEGGGWIGTRIVRDNDDCD